MRDRKKPEEPQEEGSPAWMNTYGDMVTLVLTFFVLLFSFSSIDAAKWEDIVNSLSGMQVVAISALDPNAPENTGDRGEGRFVITSPTPEVSASATPEDPAHAANVIAIKQKFDELYEKIKNHIESNNLGYILNVEYVDDETILLRMSDYAFFDPGSATIDKDATLALNEVCGILTEYQDIIRMIHIEGHTDNVPISNAHYVDNWALSEARADGVHRFIMGSTDLNPSLMVVSAYGEYHPIASNDTEEGRAKNRRVDFVIESISKVE